MSSDHRQRPPIPPANDLPGTRIDIGLADDQRLSLWFPGGHALGGGTCECKTPAAKLTDGRCTLLRERTFSSVEEMLACLFAAPATAAVEAAPFGVHLADEIVVEFPEGVDYLGSYDSIPAYLRAMLEPEVTPACAWILDHLDYPAVLRRWESDGSRLVIERGHVYRLAEELVARAE